MKLPPTSRSPAPPSSRMLFLCVASHSSDERWFLITQNMPEILFPVTRIPFGFFFRVKFSSHVSVNCPQVIGRVARKPLFLPCSAHSSFRCLLIRCNERNLNGASFRQIKRRSEHQQLPDYDSKRRKSTQILGLMSLNESFCAASWMGERKSCDNNKWVSADNGKQGWIDSGGMNASTNWLSCTICIY